VATRKPSLSEIRNPKETLSRRLADAEDEVAEPKDKEVGPGESSAPTTMSQSDFFKARTPQERAQQQKMLARKLRSMGQ
jgi:hypothetical protein